jgi:transposase
LLKQGVRTKEEADWLRWEMRYERRIARCRKRSQNLRKETYLRAVRELRQHYVEFVFEDERIHDPTRKRQTIRELQTDEQMRHRARSNRDLAARYEFTQICERYGAEILTVSARNTTRECPECGNLDENTAELLLACSGCGKVRDKDFGARQVILRRSYEPLADMAAE